MKIGKSVVMLAVLLATASAFGADGLSFGLTGGVTRSEFDFAPLPQPTDGFLDEGSLVREPGTSAYNTPWASNTQSRSGFRLGLFAEYPMYGSVLVHLGLDYAERGWGLPTMSTGRPDIQQVESQEIQRSRASLEMSDPFLRYVSVPLLVKVRPEWGRVDPFVMAGPRVDFKIGHSDDAGWEGIYDDFGAVQWGLSFGGGAEVGVSPRLAVVFGVTYNLDLEDASESDLMEVKPASMDFTTGIKF